MASRYVNYSYINSNFQQINFFNTNISKDATYLIKKSARMSRNTSQIYQETILVYTHYTPKDKAEVSIW